ncbi:hypothetical protein DS745_07980 [Anaerobacillus alkaliphilus]|uniref:Uncharacterized protein n=1 Tax=Anaerobacillus alkaliphilus TaxID=1548597 RepID=A0A4Q0VVC8_9BACI|nr:hypothetical protein [Anaerobacillus alkaliphilus]RXJ02023.1 hypothetical protein DS745_07980 [Anaerobacillus alkaliphilus]
MSNYHLCCQHRGKVVHIYEKSGKVHYGKIVDVDTEYVYIDPRVGGGPSGFRYGYPGYGGYGHKGYGAYGAGYGYGGNPYFVPVALAAVGGLALGAAFFW